MDEENIIRIVDEANVSLNKIIVQWEEYQQLKIDIFVGNSNPYLNEQALKQVLYYVDNFKSEFGNYILLKSAVYLIKKNRTQEQIKKIIKVAYLMAEKKLSDYESAAKMLNQTLNGINQFETIPEINNLSTVELVNGKAIDFLEKILEATNG